MFRRRLVSFLAVIVVSVMTLSMAPVVVSAVVSPGDPAPDHQVQSPDPSGDVTYTDWPIGANVQKTRSSVDIGQVVYAFLRFISSRERVPGISIVVEFKRSFRDARASHHKMVTRFQAGKIHYVVVVTPTKSIVFKMVDGKREAVGRDTDQSRTSYGGNHSYGFISTTIGATRFHGKPLAHLRSTMMWVDEQGAVLAYDRDATAEERLKTTNN